MIEILILFKSFLGQLSINLNQFPVECSYKLHSTHFTQKFRGGLVYGFILCYQADAEVARAEFDVPGVDEGVSFTHCLTLSWGERGGKELNLFEEDDNLICGPAFDIGWGWGEILKL